MKTIWKYPLVHGETQDVEVPQGAGFLSVIEQGGIPMLYALVDSEAPVKLTRVLGIGTGHPIDEAILRDYVFLGTVKTGFSEFISFVWHVFIRKHLA